MQVVAKAVYQEIGAWSTKRTQLFGALRQMLLAKNYSQRFMELSGENSTAMQGLQLALAAMTFLNMNDVQQQLRRVPSTSVVQAGMREAAELDQKGVNWAD